MQIRDPKPYIRVMEEIKHRVAVTLSLHERTSTIAFSVSQIESMVLQVRMITELIALASLAANREVFEQHQIKFEKHWRPNDILKDLKRINPRFYPRPVKEIDTPDGIINHVEITEGVMTPSELVEVHGRCGNILHAKNPFGKSVDYKWYKNMVPEWIDKIVKLLNCHQVHLLGEDHFHLVHMTQRDKDEVRMYTFEKHDA